MKVREMIRLLEANGWELQRINGDHRIFKKDGVENIVTVSGNLGRDIPKGQQYGVLRDAGLKK
ncbi:MAG: type II toxin-antitoxin system HicA family toxin [Bacteroidales bacterium]|nr:type II toxin-antitoxin system HicA family toxin [Bacteroidales bacterium]